MKSTRLGGALPALFAGSAVLFIGTLAANLGNYLFNFVMARLLAPAAYGDLVTLFSLGLIATVPTIGIINVITRDAASLARRGDHAGMQAVVRSGFRRIVSIGALFTAIFLAVLPLLSPVLNLSIGPAALYALIFVLVFVTALWQGILQGLQQFRLLSMLLSGQAVVKLGLGTTLVLIGYGLFGALAAVMVSQALLVLFAGAYVVRQVGWGKPGKGWGLLDRENQLVIVAMLLLYVLLNIDLFFAKHFFDPATAGAYAILSILGKVILFATASVAVALLPLMTVKADEGRPPTYLIVYALGLIYIPGFALVSVYTFWPGLITNLFPGYAIGNFLGLYGGLSLVFALLNLLVHYFIAVRDYRFLPILLISNGIAIGFMLIWHQSFFRLIAAMLLAGLAGVIGSLILMVKPKQNRKSS